MNIKEIIKGLLGVAETLTEFDDGCEYDFLRDNWSEYCNGDMVEILENQCYNDVEKIPEEVWKVPDNERPPIYHQLKSVVFILKLTKQLRNQQKK